MTKLERFLEIVTSDGRYKNLEPVQVTQKVWHIFDNSHVQPAFIYTDVVLLAKSLDLMYFFDYDFERKKVYFHVYEL